MIAPDHDIAISSTDTTRLDQLVSRGVARWTVRITCSNEFAQNQLRNCVFAPSWCTLLRMDFTLIHFDLLLWPPYWNILNSGVGIWEQRKIKRSGVGYLTELVQLNISRTQNAQHQSLSHLSKIKSRVFVCAHGRVLRTAITETHRIHCWLCEPKIVLPVSRWLCWPLGEILTRL